MASANSPQADNDYDDDFLDEPSPARTREARSPAKSPAKSPTNHNGEPTSPKAALSNRSPPKVTDKASNNKPQDDDDDPSGEAKADLFVLAYKGDVPGLTKALRKGAALHAKDQHGWTALHWAASRAHTTAITALLTAAQASAGDDNDDHSQDGQGVKSLLNAKDQLNGWTALHLAAIRGHMEVMRQLLIAGASPSLADKHGDRPVDCLGPKGKRNLLMKAWLTGAKSVHKDDSSDSDSDESSRQEAKGGRGDGKDDS